MKEQHNILIVGAGLAGLYAALNLAPRPVTVLSPMALGYGASSAWAQGGVAAAMDKNDTPEAHALDTINAGDGIVDADVAAFVTNAAKHHVLELTDVGTPFDRTVDGGFVMSKEAAHGFARVVRVKGDQAGAAIMKTLVEEVARTPSITVIEGATALELIVKDNAMQGIVVSEKNQTPYVIQAKAYLLAAGGAGSLYLKTTNPPSVRGLALGMAARAGAVIADAEFVQFHPTAMDVGLDPNPLATEALRGEGAILINKFGERYMQDVHPLAELASRDIVARANFYQHQAGNIPMLDTREAIGAHIKDEFISVYRYCEQAGIDPVTETIPIVPAAHYHMGGVATGKDGRSSITGLWVSGEAASTGLHGANRLASNGLLEALVYAATCAGGMVQAIDVGLGQKFVPDLAVPKLGFAGVNDTAVMALRKLMSDKVGVIRDGESLAEALCALRDLDIKYGGISTNFDNMLAAATLIAAAAYNRHESRGGHYRTDYPDKDENLQRRIEITYAEALALRNSL
ncbi:MAG: L-aspartate oxidase [Amylibacter sp.]